MSKKNSSKSEKQVQQTTEEVSKKEKAKLAQVPEKYQKHANLQYVRDDKARAELMKMIDELVLIEGLVLEKTGGHDLSVRYKGRQIVKICPLSKAWSASIQGDNIQRYTIEQVLERVRQVVSESSSNTSTADSEMIKKLEDRICKMSEKSKGISLKGVDVTKGVESWMKEQGYTLYDDLLLVK